MLVLLLLTIGRPAVGFVVVVIVFVFVFVFVFAVAVAVTVVGEEL